MPAKKIVLIHMYFYTRLASIMTRGALKNIEVDLVNSDLRFSSQASDTSRSRNSQVKLNRV
jgi:hypothetical protein